MSALFKHLGQPRKQTPQIGGTRFSDRYFQERIKDAREFKRAPRILPQARTNLTVGVLSIKTKIIFVAIITIVLAGAAYALFSPVFRITEIKIDGLSQLSQDLVSSWILELENNKVFGFIPGNHLLVLSKNAIETQLKEKSVLVASVQNADKHFPNKLALTVLERHPMFIWKTGDTYALISNDGLVLDEIAQSYASSTSEFLTFEDQNQTPTEYHTLLPATQAASFISALIEQWPAYVPFELKGGIASGNLGTDVYVSTDQKFKIYFTSARATGDQLHFLQLLLAYEIPAERLADLAYIDVRLAELAYYCYVGEPCESVSSPDQPQEENTEIRG